MKWLLSITVAFVWSVVVQAKSFTGNRLLVVLEEQAEREKYSVFLEDLTCKLIQNFIFNTKEKDGCFAIGSIGSMADCRWTWEAMNLQLGLTDETTSGSGPIVASNDAYNYLQPGDLLQPWSRQKGASSHF